MPFILFVSFFEPCLVESFQFLEQNNSSWVDVDSELALDFIHLELFGQILLDVRGDLGDEVVSRHSAAGIAGLWLQLDEKLPYVARRCCVVADLSVRVETEDFRRIR